MKYVININQKAIVDLGLQDKLDFIDLAIYDFITEFMLCDECRKLNIDNVQYFWIKSDLIIENMPLLGITTARGISKRIDKLIDCDLLERCNDNQNLHQSFFKVGKNYQAYKFFTWNKNSKGAWNENSNNNINDTINNNNNKEEDIIISSKKNNYQAIVDCWNEHNGKKLGKVTIVTPQRKHAIKKALVDNGITQEQLMQFFKTLPFADKWSTIMLGKDAPYTPECGGALNWNDYYGCYMYIGYWDGDISDGYTNEDRPNGAKVTLNNGRGVVVWNSETKTWIKQ